MTNHTVETRQYTKGDDFDTSETFTNLADAMQYVKKMQASAYGSQRVWLDGKEIK